MHNIHIQCNYFLINYCLIWFIIIIIFKIMPLINALTSVNLKDYIRQEDVRKKSKFNI